jgi:membrane protein DedA with SNARE-associated domain
VSVWTVVIWTFIGAVVGFNVGLALGAIIGECDANSGES